MIGDFFGDGRDDFGVFGYDRFIVVDPSTHLTLTQAFGGPEDVPSAESAATILRGEQLQAESIPDTSQIGSSTPTPGAALEARSSVDLGSTDPTLRAEALASPAGSTPTGPSSRSTRDPVGRRSAPSRSPRTTTRARPAVADPGKAVSSTTPLGIPGERPVHLAWASHTRR